MQRRWVAMLDGFLLLTTCVGCNKAQSSAQNPTVQSLPAASAMPTQTAAREAVSEPRVPEVQQRPDDEARNDTRIRRVDINAFVEAHVAELNPELADLATDCGEGQKPIQSIAPVLYGDLDGDGQEEAAVEGWSCLSGNGGADFWGVLKLMPSGNLAVLPIAAMPKTFKGRNPYNGVRGHIKLEIRDGRLVEVFPTYPDERACSNCSEGERDFVFRWDGHQFALDDIIDVAPEKSGN